MQSTYQLKSIMTSIHIYTFIILLNDIKGDQHRVPTENNWLTDIIRQKL